MATVTNFANAFETTLTADMLATDLVAEVQSTVGAPTSPCYMVLEPNNADRREYVLFDGSFSATTFSATTINNRYLAGSAGASDIVHPSGSVVRFAPVAQHFQNIQNSAVWLDEAQTITGAKTFSVDPTLADGSSALSQAEGNAAYAPVGDVGAVWLGAADMNSILGAPALGAAANRFAAWHMDPASSESVAGSWRMPPSWSTVNVDIYWSHESASATGDVRWQVLLDNAAADGSLNASGPNGQATATAGGQFVLKISRAITGEALTASHLTAARVSRLGGDAADTLGVDATLLGLRISKAS